MKLTEHQIDWIKNKNLSPHHIIIKIQNIQNKERTLRSAKEKGQVTYTEEVLSELHSTSQWKP